MPEFRGFDPGNVELKEAIFVKRFLVAPSISAESFCSFVNWVLGFIISMI